MRDKGGKRLREIIKVFTKYGIGRMFYSSSKTKNNSPKALREAFEELGATFIKFGQILSTRPDLLPEVYIRELTKLQDNNIYTDFINVKNLFFSEFGSSLHDEFLFFEEIPFASASIAQAHKAILKDGRKVVVKIQYPDIEEKMKLDMKILKKLMKHTKTKVEWNLIDPIEVLNEIEAVTLKEFDFLLEADNMVKFKELNKDIACVASPTVIKSLTSKKILTMEYIEGFKISNIELIETNGYERLDVGRKLALAFCKQVFNDGFFHGDPHPGNLLIANNRIVFLDFGIVGELTPAIKSQLNKAIICIGTRDISGLVDFVIAVGVVNGNVNTNDLYQDFQIILNKYLGASLSNVKISQLLKEIIDITNRHNIRLPKELTTLIRAMIILEGVVTQISPDLGIMDTLILFIKEKNTKGFIDELNIDELVLKTYKFTMDSLKVPTKFNELAESIARGRIKINIEISDEKFIIKNINKMVNRIAFSLVVGCMIVASSLVMSYNIGPKLNGISIIGISGYTISGIFSIWLLISIIKSGFF